MEKSGKPSKLEPSIFSILKKPTNDQPSIFSKSEQKPSKKKSKNRVKKNLGSGEEVSKWKNSRLGWGGG